MQNLRGGGRRVESGKVLQQIKKKTPRSVETATRVGGGDRQKRAASKETHRMFQWGRRRSQPHLLALRNVEHETKTTLYWEGLQGEVGHRETSYYL